MPATARRRSLKRLLLHTIAGAALGIGIGWLSRGGRESLSSSSAEKHPDTSAARALHPHSSDAQTAASVKNRAAEDPVLPLLRLFSAADKAAPREMPRVLRGARGLYGVMPFLAKHWAELDAQQMFDSLRAETGSRPLAGDPAVRKALFETWLAQDKEAALTALDDDKALADISGLRMEAARSLTHTEPVRGIAQIMKWRIGNFIDTSGITAWAAKDPAAAAEAASKANLAFVGEHMMLDIGEVWARTDPIGAMHWAMQHQGSLAGSLATGVMVYTWEKSDPAAAAAFVASVTDPAMRIKLDFPPLPREESRAEVVLPAP